MPTDESDDAPTFSGNPLFAGWYADPEMHIFEGRFYLYPTFSAPYEEQTFFEAFSSDDLTDWRSEGRILDFAEVPWSTNRAAWAPSVIERDGRYFLYFSAGDGAGIGVAVSDKPGGPFRDALGVPLIADYHFGGQPIDAHAFLDDDGQAYLYYGGWKHAIVVRLNRDMISVAEPFVEVTPANYVEGPFMLKRQGVYYYMWSEGGWGDSSYAVAWARADSPFGPFVREGVVLRGDGVVGNGAGHHSVVNLPDTDDWYIVYHRRPITETNAHRRVVCIDRMRFDAEGRILPVVITAEGVPARSLTRTAGRTLAAPQA